MNNEFINDIEKNPDTYIYHLADPLYTPIDNEEVLDCNRNKYTFIYGPYCVMQSSDASLYEAFSESFKYKNDELMRMIIIGLATRHIIKKDTTAKELKMLIRDLIDKCNKISSDDIKKSCKYYLNNIIDTLRKFQYDNKLTESVLTNYAPIIPYGMTLSKLYPREKDIVKESYDDCINYPDIDEEENRVRIDRIINDLLNYHLPEILENVYYNGLISCIDHNTLIDIMDSEGLTIGESYQLLVYLKYNYKKITNDNLSSIWKCTESIYNGESITSAIEDLSYLNEYDEIKLMNEERIREMQAELDSKAYQELKNMVLSKDLEDKDKTYNLDILLNYIYTHRIYQTSDYVNGLFLKIIGTIKDYAYYDNFLIAELDDDTIGIPVFDMSAGMKLKVVCVGKDGKIFIKDNALHY